MEKKGGGGANTVKGPFLSITPPSFNPSRPNVRNIIITHHPCGCSNEGRFCESEQRSNKNENAVKCVTHTL